MPECSKCVEGSGNTVGHPGRHRVALPQLSGEKRDRAQLGDDDTQGTGAVDCALCLKGSGNPAGHRGRHASKLKVPKPAKQEGPCTFCIEGSGNMVGHRGRHQTVKKVPKVTEGPCPKCIEGGKQAGHRGRHVAKLPVKKDKPTSLEGEACPHCYEGSFKAAGHRGRHILKKEEVAPTTATEKHVEEDATVLLPRLEMDEHDVVSLNADPSAPCSRCIEGSGNLVGHRGRHLFKKKRMKVSNGSPGGPCEACVEGSGNLAGHRGRHRA